MDADLLFIPLNSVQWKECSSHGFIKPSKQEGATSEQNIQAYTPALIEEILNFKYIDQNDLLLIIIDPIRVQVPIKNVADRATLWIIRDHKKHGSKTARELGKDYQPFFSDVRVKVTNRISDKPEKEPAEVDSGNY